MLLSVVSKLICVCVVPPNLQTVAYVYKEGNTKGKKLEFPITFPAIVQQVCLYMFYSSFQPITAPQNVLA